MFKENVLLSEFSNYKIGGPARHLFEATTKEELKAAIEEAKKRNLDILVIGGGTNILFPDEGYPGLVIKPSINFIEISAGEVSVGAGVLVSDLINFSIERSLSGFEWAGGLPGTVGGAIRGNAGAFGGEMKDSVKAVRSMDMETLEETERNFSDCEFAYRSSVFKNPSNKEIILSAIFKLSAADSKKIKRSVDEKISYRQERQPLEYPNIGSIFKNIDIRNITEIQKEMFKNVIKTDPFPVVPAAHVISEAGLKGISSGGAMISPKHPNFIINSSNAKASDVKNLIALIKKEVKKKFDINLEEEIIQI